MQGRQRVGRAIFEEGEVNKIRVEMQNVERVLAQIWADVLEVEHVGIEDNFFELGGDSILTIQVVSRLRAALADAPALVAQAQEISSRIQADARTQAQADAEVTLARARNEIQLERDSAIADLRKEFADLTIAAAEKVINQSLDRNAHRRLIDEALAESSFRERN